MGAPIGPMNPIEGLLNSLNTNSYLIGVSMLMLNLGGRHLATGLTPEQDKFFQNPWIRRGLLFVVIFVATRNIFTALWLTLGVILAIGYLFNEHSYLYLMGEPIEQPAPVAPLPLKGLTGEEQDIYKRLHDKAERVKAEEALKAEAEKGQFKLSLADRAQSTYEQNMKQVTGFSF
jgi:hypothetical protein